MKYSNETTSYQAAVDNLPRLGDQQRRVLEEIRRWAEGLTRDEIEVHLNLSGNAVRPRVKELIEAELIEETDRTRKTRSGSQATVLVASNVGSNTKGSDQPRTEGLAERALPSEKTLGVASGAAASPLLPVPAEARARSPYNCWIDEAA